MKTKLVMLLTVVALVAAACGGGSSGEPSATTAPSDATTTTTTVATTTPEPSAAEVSVVSGSLGDFLADGDGNTLYLFTKDEQKGESVCYDDCAVTWPPLTDPVAAGTGVDPSLLGTTDRTDGITQMTYNGWPLYYFAGDAAPGETNGQGVKDVWYVIDATGNEIGSGS